MLSQDLMFTLSHGTESSTILLGMDQKDLGKMPLNLDLFAQVEHLGEVAPDRRGNFRQGSGINKADSFGDAHHLAEGNRNFLRVSATI